VSSSSAAPAPLGKLRRLAPGLILPLTIAAAAAFISEHHGGPQMLYALLLGICLSFASQLAQFAPGIALAGSSLLRLGIVLLGLRVTLSDIASLGPLPLVIVSGGLAAVFAIGLLLARRLGLSRSFSVLSAGSVGICGASAAIAIAAVLPRHEDNDKHLAFVVVAVTSLSTMAMILYPALAVMLGLDHRQAGIFIGATIHDVAQVVGAGYSISPESGEIATYVKLLRVSLLLPVIVLLSLLFRTAQPSSAGGARPPFPVFVLGFAALVLLNSTVAVPQDIHGIFDNLSRWLLCMAIAAIGLKTSLHDVVKLSYRPALLILAETLSLMIIVLLFLHLF